MLFTDTVTLYNCYMEQGEQKWKRTVLTGVMVTRDIDKVVTSDGVIKTRPAIKVTIPYRKGYVPFWDYTGDGWTIGLANLDIITLGECAVEISDAYSIKDLKKDRPDTWTINRLADCTNRTFLPHWEVGCEA